MLKVIQLKPFYPIKSTNPTVIEEVKGEESEANTEIYDLQGRRVINPTKGLYIVNGKKVMF